MSDSAPKHGILSSIEPVILLLALLWVISLIGMFLAEFYFKSDAVFYTSISGMGTTLLGGLMLKITGRDKPSPPNPGTTTATQTTQVTETPPEAK